MKPIYLVFILSLFLSCSSDDDSSVQPNLILAGYPEEDNFGRSEFSFYNYNHDTDEFHHLFSTEIPPEQAGYNGADLFFSGSVYDPYVEKISLLESSATSTTRTLELPGEGAYHLGVSSDYVVLGGSRTHYLGRYDSITYEFHVLQSSSLRPMEKINITQMNEFPGGLPSILDLIVVESMIVATLGNTTEDTSSVMFIEIESGQIDLVPVESDILKLYYQGDMIYGHGYSSFIAFNAASQELMVQSSTPNGGPNDRMAFNREEIYYFDYASILRKMTLGARDSNMLSSSGEYNGPLCFSKYLNQLVTFEGQNSQEMRVSMIFLDEVGIPSQIIETPFNSIGFTFER